MKQMSFKSPLVIIFLVIFTYHIDAKEPAVSESNQIDVGALIAEITETIRSRYVSEAAAEKIIEVVNNNHKAGIYDSFDDPGELAVKLQSDLRSVNNDLHLSVDYVAHKQAQPKPKNSEHIPVSQYGMWNNYGLQEIKVLDGNIGYLKINHFGRWHFREKHRATITAAINFLQNSDALILDVRNNQGGYEDIVAYLISYFFEGDRVHLSDYYNRYEDKTTSLYTSTDVPGARMVNVPIYVLISGNTTSAGESLAYMLKHLGKAKIIGEQSAGAGHGALRVPLGSGFSMNVSSEVTINAVTKTSFEAVGVVPDMRIPAKKSLDQAYLMALDYLKDHNTKKIAADNYERVKSLLPPATVTGNLPLGDYVGRYVSDGVEINVTSEEGQLWAHIKGKGTVEFIAQGDHVFVVKMANERVKFVVTEDQQISGLMGLDSPMNLQRVDD